MAIDIPELRSPKLMYENAVAMGVYKAANVEASPLKTVISGMLSGCYIALGKPLKICRLLYIIADSILSHVSVFDFNLKLKYSIN